MSYIEQNEAVDKDRRNARNEDVGAHTRVDEHGSVNVGEKDGVCTENNDDKHDGGRFGHGDVGAESLVNVEWLTDNDDKEVH